MRSRFFQVVLILQEEESKEKDKQDRDLHCIGVSAWPVLQLMSSNLSNTKHSYKVAASGHVALLVRIVAESLIKSL